MYVSAANSDITFYLLKIYKPFPIITSGRFAALKTAKACWMAFGSAIAIGGAKHGGITLGQKKEPIFESIVFLLLNSQQRRSLFL